MIKFYWKKLKDTINYLNIVNTNKLEKINMVIMISAFAACGKSILSEKNIKMSLI